MGLPFGNQTELRHQCIMSTMRYASIFTGAMGLDIGLEHNGFETVLAVEHDKHAQATIKVNRPNIQIISDAFDPTLIDTIKKAKVDAIVGGPPCQSWSYAGKRQGLEDHRGLCIPRFLDIVEAIRPGIVVMENVMGLVSAQIDGRKGAVIQMIEDRLLDMDYCYSIETVNSADYGTPQCRKRVIVMAILGPYMPSSMKLENHPTHSKNSPWGLPKWKTLKNAIGDRPSGEGMSYPESKLKFFRMLKAGQDWRDLPDELKQQAMKGAINSSGGRTGFFRRLSWDKPSPTLTCSPVGKANAFCHPDEDRPLNVVEYARIQGFPNNWEFKGPLSSRYKQIGNAIPVQLGEAIGRALL